MKLSDQSSDACFQRSIVPHTPNWPRTNRIKRISAETTFLESKMMAPHQELWRGRRFIPIAPPRLVFFGCLREKSTTREQKMVSDNYCSAPASGLEVSGPVSGFGEEHRTRMRPARAGWDAVSCRAVVLLCPCGRTDGLRKSRQH